MQVGKYEKMCHVLLMKGKANEKIPQKMFVGIIEAKTTFEIVFLQNVSFWLDVAFPTLSYVSSLGQNRDKLIFGNVTNEKKGGSVGWGLGVGIGRKEGRGVRGIFHVPPQGGYFRHLAK